MPQRRRTISVTRDHPATLDTGVFASHDIAPGEVVLELTGSIVTTPYKYSLQVGTSRHLAPGSVDPTDPGSEWCFVNHGCEPNCYVDAERMAIVAWKPISAGEELFFNYCATEYEMACPFTCHCGAATCYRDVRGFRHLSGAQQTDLVPLLAPHLLAMRH